MAIGSISNGEVGSSVRSKLNASLDFIDNIESNMIIERVYDGVSSLTAQEPSGIDIPIFIQFGAVQGTPSDPVQTLAQGGDTEASILRINQAGTYRIKIQAAIGRTGSANTSIINLRALINGTQAGRSVQLKFSSATTTSDFIDEAWLTLPAGVDITYQLIRDTASHDSGGLLSGTVGNAGWNASTSAALRVERWVSGV